MDLARSHGPLGPTWRFLTSDCNISAVRNYELVVLHSFTTPLLQLVRTCQNWTSLKTSHVQNMVETCSIISQKPDVGLSKSSKDRPTRFKKKCVPIRSTHLFMAKAPLASIWIHGNPQQVGRSKCTKAWHLNKSTKHALQRKKSCSQWNVNMLKARSHGEDHTFSHPLTP